MLKINDWIRNECNIAQTKYDYCWFWHQSRSGSWHLVVQPHIFRPQLAIRNFSSHVHGSLCRHQLWFSVLGSRASLYLPVMSCSWFVAILQRWDALLRILANGLVFERRIQMACLTMICRERIHCPISYSSSSCWRECTTGDPSPKWLSREKVAKSKPRDQK